MAYDYFTYVSQLANLMVISPNDANFGTFLPGCIDYAEQRIYRELDLLQTQVTDSAQCSSGVRNYALPTNTGTFIVVDNINILTPLGATITNGTRNPCYPVSREYIDGVFPSGVSDTGVPQVWAMLDQGTVILGPSPDAGYNVEVVGTQRPAPLSASNSSTFLTQYLPDLFMAASMVFATGYQRDFGAQGADNPGASVSWETQYQTLFKSADSEEMRKKYQGEAWTSESPAPQASPPRV